MDYTDLAKEFLQAIYKFCKIRSQRQLNSAMQGEAFALQFIAQHNDLAVPSDIESAMCVSSARIATILNGLEGKGLVVRRIDPSDHRRTILKLTPLGEEQAAKNSGHLLDLGKELLAYLGEDDAKHYVRIMSKLSDR